MKKMIFYLVLIMLVIGVGIGCYYWFFAARKRDSSPGTLVQGFKTIEEGESFV